MLFFNRQNVYHSQFLNNAKTEIDTEATKKSIVHFGLFIHIAFEDNYDFKLVLRKDYVKIVLLFIQMYSIRNVVT